ncbi:MAG: circularly permuted type 2 ATP-grasp protein [Henriciella sp.]|uniref:circularly permuted type 2 ATP-grasp protein n=1 Tax=Henriciella sp. TaxID=1968823 RepID=UPI0032EDF3E8
MAEPSPAAPGNIWQMLDSYQPAPIVPDELVDAHGDLRPAWNDFLQYLSAQSPAVMESLFRRGDTYLRDSGVFLRQYTNEVSRERPWPLSHMPVLIHEREWDEISNGLKQRADLLERVAADLYGENTLVRDGFLPGRLIAESPEWLRQLVGVKPPSGKYLHFLAFEIGRGPNGQWWVLNDRTQAPSGAGYALENRVATSRIYAEHYANAKVLRLSSFFRDFRTSLLNLRRSPDHHVAIMTPGPYSETYYEQAYIARYLGLLLVEGEDLTVHKGEVHVRTVSGLQPVDVLWRRLDALYSDPLELEEGSKLGTPGLVGAARRGTVSMVNALGTGVLETRALMAFLPRIARQWLGEPLTLPNIATWWCGQAKERRHVLENVEKMMIAPALSTRMPFDPDETTVLAGQLKSSVHPTVQQLIDEEGTWLVGQEAVSFSTSPVFADGRLQPRPMSMRVFMVRTENGWSVMPGGFARIGPEEGSTVLNMQKGGSVADVWIVSDNPVDTHTRLSDGTSAMPRARQGALPSNAAENLFWLGRYVDRAEGFARLNRAYHSRLADAEPPGSPLLKHLSGYMKFIGLDVADAMPRALVGAIDATSRTAGSVRDRLSPDGWAAISEIVETVHADKGEVTPGDETARRMVWLLRESSGFTGLVHENMYRFTEWRFLSLGRSVERLMALASALASFLHPNAPEGALDLALEYGDSTISHRRRYAFMASRLSVIELLALDPLNPRSLIFHLDELKAQVGALPGAAENGHPSEVYAQTLRIHTNFRTMKAEAIDTNALLDFRAQIATLSDALGQAYMS